MKNSNFKKLFLSIFSGAIFTFPILNVVSCSLNKNEPQTIKTMPINNKKPKESSKIESISEKPKTKPVEKTPKKTRKYLNIDEKIVGVKKGEWKYNDWDDDWSDEEFKNNGLQILNLEKAQEIDRQIKNDEIIFFDEKGNKVYYYIKVHFNPGAMFAVKSDVDMQKKYSNMWEENMWKTIPDAMDFVIKFSKDENNDQFTEDDFTFETISYPKIENNSMLATINDSKTGCRLDLTYYYYEPEEINDNKTKGGGYLTFSTIRMDEKEISENINKFKPDSENINLIKNNTNNNEFDQIYLHLLTQFSSNISGTITIKPFLEKDNQ